MHLSLALGAASAPLLLSTLLSCCHARPNTGSSSTKNATSTAPETGNVINIAEAKKEGAVFHGSTYPANAAAATAINIPTLVSASILGPATGSPATQYVAMPTQALPQLTPSENTTHIINMDLAAHWEMWNGSGTLAYTQKESAYVKNLWTTPSYSRDSGRGGTINGQHMFIFADTNTYTQPSAEKDGTFTGAVSNSIAMDVGLLAAKGQPPALMDPMGAMASSNGALRGFVPWTEGEAAYNRENVGHSRWAIWPAQSLITLTPQVSLQYSPIVWVNTSGGVTTYTQAGVTLCEISIPSGGGGPVAKRVATRLFPMGALQWGVIGGVRSYGSSGVNGGNVYIFGKTTTGLILGRVSAINVANADAYQFYYPGSGWSKQVPPRGSTNTFYNGSFSAIDVFYSPRHLTFIMVYMNSYVDNRIYWRYLEATTPILPTYAGGKDSDIAQYLTQYKWSPQSLLLQLPTPPVEYSYDGGAQPGYFGANDITNGGTKMLLSWTEPNGESPAGLDAGYWLNTATATWA